MDAGFADHAWSNDQCIARLTGQVFSPAYRGRVLSDLTQPFDSGAAMLALIAAILEDPSRGVAALHAIQRARYVDGTDTSDRAMLDGLGLTDVARRIAAPDAALLAAAEDRIGAGWMLLARSGARGVPTLLAAQGGTTRTLPAAAVYGDAGDLLASLRAV